MRSYIAVACYTTDALRYCGTSESKAASALEPGTQFGLGETAPQAIQACHDNCRYARLVQGLSIARRGVALK